MEWSYARNRKKMERRFRIPVVNFDGDQADERNFSTDNINKSAGSGRNYGRKKKKNRKR